MVRHVEVLDNVMPASSQTYISGVAKSDLFDVKLKINVKSPIK